MSNKNANKNANPTKVEAPTNVEENIKENANPPSDTDIVEVKVLVNVWDHTGKKCFKNTTVRLLRKQADQLIKDGKSIRIDPIPAVE